MIGDTIIDLRAGKAAGLKVVAVEYGYGLVEDLRGEGADEFWRGFGVCDPTHR